MNRLLALALLTTLLVSLAPGQTPPSGKFRGELVDPDTKEVLMKVAMHVPKELPPKNKPLTLLFLCHGYNGNEGNYFGLTVQALERLKLDNQFVVISGKSKNVGWTAEDDARVFKVIDYAKKHYPIDPRRIYFFGSSNGAAFVGRFGWEHEDKIAGVVGYCGGYKPFKDLRGENPGDNRTEWYFVHGSKDNAQNSKKASDALNKLGYRANFRQMDGYGHTDIWDSGGHPSKAKADAVRDDCQNFFHALRHKQIAPPADDVKTLEAAAAEPDKADWSEVARIGGPPAAKAILAGFASKEEKTRQTAAKACVTTLFDREVVRGLVKLLDDPSTQVKEAAMQALARAACWRYVDAQQALARLARKKDAPAADRLHAVEALAYASHLIPLGNFEDGLLPWSLALALDDDDAKVREAAIKSLTTWNEDALGYKADAPAADRQAASAKWREWCQAKCGAMPELK